MQMSLAHKTVCLLQQLFVESWEDDILMMMHEPGNLPIIIVLDYPNHEELVVLKLLLISGLFFVYLNLFGDSDRFFYF